MPDDLFRGNAAVGSMAYRMCNSVDRELQFM